MKAVILAKEKARLFSLFWGFILITMQWFFFTKAGGLELSQSKAVYFVLAIVFSLAVFGINQNTLKLSILPLMILPFVALFKITSIMDMNCVTEWLCFTFGLLLFIQVYTLDIDLEIFVWSASIACIIQSIWIIGNYFNFDFYQLIASTTKVKLNGQWTNNKFAISTLLSGGLGNRGYTGGLIGVALPFLLDKKRIWAIPLPIAALALIYMAGTGSPIIMLIFCGLSATMLLASEYDRLSIMAFGICTGVTLVSVDKIRVGAWKSLVGLSHWYNGFGFGFGESYFVNMFKFDGLAFGKFHNEYLEAIVALGPLAIFLFYYAIKSIWTPKKETILFWISAQCLLLYSIVWFPFHISSTALIGIFSFAILLKKIP